MKTIAEEHEEEYKLLTSDLSKMLFIEGLKEDTHKLYGSKGYECSTSGVTFYFDDDSTLTIYDTSTTTWKPEE